MKLTPWFDGRLHKPARPGVYQQRNGLGAIGYQRWDGKHWHLWCRTAPEAAKLRGSYVNPSYQNDDWRGLAADPEGGAA